MTVAARATVFELASCVLRYASVVGQSMTQPSQATFTVLFRFCTQMSETKTVFDHEIWRQRRSGDELTRPGAGSRDPFARDRARVIHSAGFRRLQAKTQVLGIGEGDFHRTRLTHSMEVAQVARGIVWTLKHVRTDPEKDAWEGWLPDPNLIETIALCHDLGHPPFGHGGEVALNFAMREAGGFEGNGQTLRLLSRLEAHTDRFGLDLTRRTLLGILKYPVPYSRVVRQKLADPPAKTSGLRRDDWKPPKCYMDGEEAIVQWLLEPLDSDDRSTFANLKRSPDDNNHGKSAHCGFDTSIMELADDIAYGVHDFEDGISLGLVSLDDWKLAVSVIDADWGGTVSLDDPMNLGRDLFNSSASARKRAIGCLVNAFIVSIGVTQIPHFKHPLLRNRASLDPSARKVLDELMSIVVKRVIKTPQVQTLEYRGQHLIVELFDALDSDPKRFLTKNWIDQYLEADSDKTQSRRVLCDFIAGMTDHFANRMFERLFVPRHGMFSDPL